MKEGIHPDYKQTTIKCACGAVIETGSTKENINVEICSTVKAVRYLYKYIYKGHDKVAFHITSDHNNANIDEISQF